MADITSAIRRTRSPRSEESRLCCDRKSEEQPLVCLLSGWSSGPLEFLVSAIKARGIGIDFVPLPMPPCGCYWLANPFVLVLCGEIAAIFVGCRAVGATLSKRDAAIACVGIVIAGIAACRVTIALIVRFSIYHGARNAAKSITGSTRLVIGFSWGGGVAHWLRSSGGWNGPTLLLAPTSIAMASIALTKVPPLPRPDNVAVITAALDDFCPTNTDDVYRILGCHPVLKLEDTHVLCQANSIATLIAVANDLLDLSDGDHHTALDQSRAGTP